MLNTNRSFVIVMLMCLSSTLVLGYGSGTSASMHLKLTSVLFSATAPANLANLVLSPNVYPDLSKFKQTIIDASNAEVGHHNPADYNTEYWYGNEGQWENFLRASQYPTKAFQGAYQSIGYLVHLTEDSTVPAHDRVIFHGYPNVYYVAPGGGLLDGTKYPTVRSDGVEFMAGDYDLSTLPVVTVPLSTFHGSPGTWSNTPQSYNSSSTTCQNVSRKLWLTSGELAAPTHPDDYAGLAGAPATRTWGAYSFPTARGCHYPPVGGDLDWYPRRLYTTTAVEAPQTAHAMGRAAVYLAIKLSSDLLKRVSSTLPPVVTPPAARISGAFASGGASTFRVHVQDNRTQGVFVTMKDAATGRTVRASVSAPGSPAQTVDLDGSLRVPLTRQSDTDLTVLPWADQISLTWDGTLSGGGRIAAGDQTIDVAVKDEDGNVATSAILITSGTSTTTAPVITQQPASVSVAAGQTASFTVGATGSSPLIYQWRRNGAAIAGATLATYSLQATTSTDSGAAFSVNVSNAAGVVTSLNATLTVTSAVVPPPIATDLAVNGGFESGTTGWTGTTKDIGTWKAQPAHAGKACAFLMGYGRTTTDVLAQSVALPAGLTSATLSFYLHIGTAETTTTNAYDKLTVQVLSSSGAVLATLGSYSNLNAASGYMQKVFDVTTYKGQRITLKFTGTEDLSKQTSFVIDDVSLLTK